MKAAPHQLLSMVLTFFFLPACWGQTQPAAKQSLYLSTFGGATGTWTGLAHGRNIGLTAGADLVIPHFRSFIPAAEIRAAWPIDQGSTESLRDLLGGVRISRVYGTMHPYADLLYGRTEIHYSHGGYVNATGTYLYLKSPSNMLSLGGGGNFDLTRSFSVKADIQWQYYDSPVVSSGHLWAVPVTFGVVYHFHFKAE